MPNIKSAKKELRKTVKRHEANVAVKKNVNELIKKSTKAIVAKDKDAKETVIKTIKAIDKMAKKGLIKKNTASRRKSRLQKKVNTLK
ncbi:MAG: 30S ribosomal protein S20 [Candidatus Falkowbacteria bacterium]